MEIARELRRALADQRIERKKLGLSRGIEIEIGLETICRDSKHLILRKAWCHKHPTPSTETAGWRLRLDPRTDGKSLCRQVADFVLAPSASIGA